MPHLTADHFLELVRKSELVDAERLRAYVEQVRATGALPADAGRLAGLMVRDAILTRFQAEQLLAGRWRGFFLGKYKILEKLGSGGMGTVYLAEHRLMHRRVALKVLPKSRAADPAARERFYREAKAVAALDHPNIVRAYDVDQAGEIHFLVMEYVDGPSLQHIVKVSGPLPVARAAHYIRQAACGLQHAHEVGLVHRDIKPSNLLVDRTGTVKLLDMGLARFFTDQDDLLTRKYDENVLGTADYLAPEQALDSHNVDIRADIYSLGGTFYFCLTGQAPFGEGTVAQKLIWHQTRQPRPIGEFRQDVPAHIVALVERMLQKDPAKRFQVPAEVAAALEPWSQIADAVPSDAEMPSLSPAARSGSSSQLVSGRARPASSGGSSFTLGSEAATEEDEQTRIRTQSIAASSGSTVPDTPSAVSGPPSPAPGAAVPASAEAIALSKEDFAYAAAGVGLGPSASGPTGGSSGTDSGSASVQQAPTGQPIGHSDTPSRGPSEQPTVLPSHSERRSQHPEPDTGPRQVASPGPQADPGRALPRVFDLARDARRTAQRRTSKQLWIALGAGVLVGSLVVVYIVWQFLGTTTARPQSEKTGEAPAPVVPKSASRTWYVGKLASRPEQLTSIAAALEKAEPGDRIVVADRDVYQESLHFHSKHRQVTVEAPEGAILRPRSDQPVDEPLVSIEHVEGVQVRGLILEGNGRLANGIRIRGSCPGLTLDQLKVRGFIEAGVRFSGARGAPGREITLRQMQWAGASAGAPRFPDAAVLFDNKSGPHAAVRLVRCDFVGGFAGTVVVRQALTGTTFEACVFLGEGGEALAFDPPGASGEVSDLPLGMRFISCTFAGHDAVWHLRALPHTVRSRLELRHNLLTGIKKAALHVDGSDAGLAVFMVAEANKRATGLPLGKWPQELPFDEEDRQLPVPVKAPDGFWILPADYPRGVPPVGTSAK